jgi:hypothetical protein
MTDANCDVSLGCERSQRGGVGGRGGGAECGARETKTEDLGMRTIAGVEAHGTRTTRTIAPGDEGNDLPLVVMDEMWRSKEFGLVVLGITDDPRVGRKTFEVEELSSSEPDASVFAPPDGYKIVERNAVGNDSTKP